MTCSNTQRASRKKSLEHSFSQNKTPARHKSPLPAFPPCRTGRGHLLSPVKQGDGPPTSPRRSPVGPGYLVIIVSQGSAQLIVVHVRFVFPESPQLGHFFCFEELEFTIVGGPADQMLMLLVQQQLQQELPQGDCTLHTWGGRGGSEQQGRRPGQGPNAILGSPPPPRNLTKSPSHPFQQATLNRVFGLHFGKGHDSETQESAVTLVFTTHSRQVTGLHWK